MSTYAIDEREENLGGGLFGAIALHAALAAAIVAFALLGRTSQHWGEHSSETGAIQASMVSAIPLPQKAPPVDKSVLASEDVSKAPTPPPKEATQPPPRPEDVLIKAKTPEKAITKPTTITPPKHPQPTPDSRKATSGEAATQLPQSIAQVTHGTATLTVQNRTFGDRYAYYLEGVGRTVSQNWFTQEIDPRTPVGRSVTITFDIQRDGTPTNVRIQTPSGVQSLDASALHALQRVDGFGPLPAGNQITVADTFEYHR
jgi:protein TonB